MPARRKIPQLSMRLAPQQARSRATVEAILEAAARILERDGLAGYTTNAVAERAGVSIGTLYQYFPNRDALTAALAARVQQARVEKLEALIASAKGLSLDAAIDILVAGIASGEAAAPRFAAALDHEEARLPLDAVTAPALARIDAALAAFLAPHLPTLGTHVLHETARAVRAIARALIDEFLPDNGAAAVRGVRAYLSAL